MTIKSINPSNYEVLGEVKVSAAVEIKSAVANAHKALPAWQTLGVEGRVKKLQKLYQVFAKNQAELAKLASAEMGMPITQVNYEFEDNLHYFQWYLDNASSILKPEVVHQDNDKINTVYREPIGVAAVIVPWNFVFANMVWQVIPNLIAGNTVVFKHSEEVILCAKKINELFQIADLPKGVFSQVFGDGKVGDQLVHQDVDLISFTGSTKVGKHLYQVAADKFIKVVLEMGGSAPGIVCADADLDVMAEVVDFNRYGNCGQICDGLKRLIVHESIFDQVVTKLKSLLEVKKVGPATDPKTDIGPLVAKRQLDFLEFQVQDALNKGAKLVTGGAKPKHLSGAFYQPTIITNIKPTMRVWQEEVFGPVLPIITFKADAQAVKLANDTQYGLGGYIISNNLKKAQHLASQLKTGMVAINNTTYLEPDCPFGGYKRSGLGREHGHFGLEDLTQVKVIATPK